MPGSYFPPVLCESSPQRACSREVWAPAAATTNKTLIVLNEVSLLSLEAGPGPTQISKGDSVLILAETSQTNPNGFLVVVDPAGAGTWLAFAVVGNSKALLLPTDDPHILGEQWNNGGFVCISQG